MSLILDALKKSDNERKTRIAPGTADVPTAPPKSGPPTWLLWFAGLLVINLGVLVLVLMRSGDDDSAASGGRIVLPQTAQSNPVAADPRLTPTKETVRPLAGEAVPRLPQTDRSNTAGGAPSATSAPTTTTAQPNTATTPARATGGVVEPEALPLFETLRASGTLSMADLNIDLHVFNTDAASRFVFVNGKRYGEGETLSEGPRVDEIRRDGIALNYRGERFLLPRE